MTKKQAEFQEIISEIVQNGGQGMARLEAGLDYLVNRRPKITGKKEKVPPHKEEYNFPLFLAAPDLFQHFQSFEAYYRANFPKNQVGDQGRRDS